MNKAVWLRALLVITAGSLVFGCATPKGFSVQDKRASVRKMKAETLAKLFEEKPETRSMVKQAAGYGVFSNIGTYLIFLSTGHGYGIVVNNRTGEETFMKMGRVGAGLGMGVKDFRAVFLFRDPQVLKEFVEKGWKFGGQADAAAKSGEKGGSVSGEAYLERDIVIYRLTEAGVALQATIGGTKYWKDDELN